MNFTLIKGRCISCSNERTLHGVPTMQYRGKPVGICTICYEDGI